MCSNSDVNIDALLFDPVIRGQIIAKLMKLKEQFQPSSTSKDSQQVTATTALPAKSTKPSNPLAALPSLPNGISPDLLENPQIQQFIKNNPDIVKQIASNPEGLPSPDKLEALLSLAAPPPEGVEQGLFGPDVFAGEEFDVQGFGDYEYDEEYDYDEDEDTLTIEDYPEYGDFEGTTNELDERKGKSLEKPGQSNILKFKYRLVTQPEQKYRG